MRKDTKSRVLALPLAFPVERVISAFVPETCMSRLCIKVGKYVVMVILAMTLLAGWLDDRHVEFRF